MPDPPSPLQPALGAVSPNSLEYGFGFNAAAAPQTIWIVKRSIKLAPGGWTEIYRFDGPSQSATLAPDVTATIDSALNPTSVLVTYESAPGPRAFYRFESRPAP